MGILTVLLVILAIGIGLTGVNYLTQATLGVGVICTGVLFAVLARMAQSSNQHSAVMKRNDPLLNESWRTAPPEPDTAKEDK